MIIFILREYTVTFDDNDYIKSIQSQFMMMMIIFREYTVTIDDYDYIKRVFSHN